MLSYKYMDSHSHLSILDFESSWITEEEKNV